MTIPLTLVYRYLDVMHRLIVPIESLLRLQVPSALVAIVPVSVLLQSMQISRFLRCKRPIAGVYLALCHVGIPVVLGQ